MNLFLDDPTREPDETDVVILHRTPRGWEPLSAERLGLTQQDVDREHAEEWWDEQHRLAIEAYYEAGRPD